MSTPENPTVISLLDPKTPINEFDGRSSLSYNQGQCSLKAAIIEVSAHLARLLKQVKGANDAWDNLRHTRGTRKPTDD